MRYGNGFTRGLNARGHSAIFLTGKKIAFARPLRARGRPARTNRVWAANAMGCYDRVRVPTLATGSNYARPICLICPIRPIRFVLLTAACVRVSAALKKLHNTTIFILYHRIPVFASPENAKTYKKPQKSGFLAGFQAKKRGGEGARPTRCLNRTYRTYETYMPQHALRRTLVCCLLTNARSYLSYMSYRSYTPVFLAADRIRVSARKHAFPGCKSFAIDYIIPLKK